MPPLPKPRQPPQPQSEVGDSDNPFKKEMGYAEMYRLKRAEGSNRRKANTHASSQINNSANSIFKLNSIVEEARQQVIESNRVKPVSQGNSEHLTESIATNSREESQRVRHYDIQRINNNMQIINDKLARKR